MASEEVKGAIVPGQQSSMNGEVAETTVTSGNLGVRTGAAVVAENGPPPLQEQAPGEPPHTPTPSPSLGLHGSKPSSVESRAPEEKQPAPLSADMVVPVKPSDSADAKKSEVTDPIRRPKTPSGSPRPPSSNGSSPLPPSPVERPLSKEEESADMGAEGSKFGPGKFRKASSTDIHPLEEKVSVAKRSASSSSGFLSKNGRGSVSGTDASNGHRDFVQSVAEEQEKSVAGGRPPSRQDTSPLPEKVEEKRKSPPLGPPSPVPTASKSPTPTKVSSKPSSPDLMVHPVSSPKMSADSAAGSKAKEDVHTKTPSPDLKEKERIIADSKKSDADKGKSPSADDRKTVKSPSPDLLKIKSNGSLRASPEPPHEDRKSSEGISPSKSPKGEQDRKIPAADNGGYKSPQPPKSKTPSPDMKNTTEIKSVSPDIIKKGTQESHSPEPVKEKPPLEQMKGSTPSPEPLKVKSGSPDVICSSPSQLSTTKPSSPDLKKEASKTIADSNVIKHDTSHPSGFQQETKNILKQKVSSPEIGLNKSPSPDAAMEMFKSMPSLIQPITEDKLKTKSPDLLPKTSSPDIPKSKSVSPEPSKGKPNTPEPHRSKPPTPEPSKPKTSINGLDADSRRPSSRLSNISDNGVKGSPTPPKTKSPSPELGKPKSDSPDLPIPKGKSPNLPSPISSSPEPNKKTGVDHRSPDSGISEQEVKKLTEEKIEKPVTSKQEADVLRKPSPISPEPDKMQTPHDPSRSKPSTPEPLKSKSQSQESIKADELRSASTKPLQKQTSNQKLNSKSPSPEVGHRTSNPPSLPPSPEPMNLKKSPSPDINYIKSASPTQISKDHPPAASTTTPGVDKKVSESSDIAAVKLSPSPDLSKQKTSPEGRKSPADVVADSRVSPSKVPEATAGKISPVKKEEEIVSKSPLMKKSGSPEPVKSPSPLPPKSASPKVSREDSSGSKKSPSPTSLKPASPETFLPSDTSEGISSLPPKSATPDSTKSMSSGSPKPPSPMIPKSPSPTADKPPKAHSPTIPTSPSPTLDKSSKTPSPIIPKSSSPTADKLTKSPSPILQKSPSPTKDKPPKSPSPTTDKLPKSPSPVIPKSPSPSIDKKPSPLIPKSPSPTADKLQTSPSPEGKPISPAVSKSPASPDKVKSPSPVGKKSPSPELLQRKTPDKVLTLEQEKMKTAASPEPMVSGAEKVKDKSPSPDLDERKSNTSAQSEQTKRPGSRQGVSPEFVLSPSEDSGRTSASPDHFERKSSTPPKPVSPLPSSTPLTDRTPTSPTDSRRAGDARTPDAKVTATSSPTSEVGDEASSISRTESGSARASSAEAATPDEEAKVAVTPLGDEIQDGEVKKEEKVKDEEKAEEETKKKKADSSKPGTPSRTPRTPRSVVPSPRTPRRTTPRSRRKDGGHEKISDTKGKSMETKPSTNGEVCSPTKRSPTKTPAKKSPGTPTAATSSPARPPLKSPAKSKTPPALAAAPTPESEKKKVPMNKVQVGTAASPNLKAVRSKIGSLDNASYKPGGGKVKIENRKLDFSKAAPKIAAKNDAYIPGGGDKKIQQVKLNWSAKPKVGSLDNATYKPGGGEKKIETVKLDFKEKAKPKVGSKDNIKHAPGGGTVKKTSGTKDDSSSDIESQKLEFKAQSKVGSMDNVKHKPGGGERKIFDDKDYLKQVGGSSSKASSEGRASGAQSPLPPMSPQRFLEENSVEES